LRDEGGGMRDERKEIPNSRFQIPKLREPDMSRGKLTVLVVIIILIASVGIFGLADALSR
jgi:hypothetical protein